MPFKIIRDDITRVSADAIVNTANPEPTFGSGTDSAVYKAAGRSRLLRERRKIGRIAPGEAAVTDAFRLPAKYIIHTVGPEWVDGRHGELDTLASCYRKSLLLAEKLGCGSIAFPLISTGSYGFPKDEALRIALEQIKSFLEDAELDVTLVVFGRESYQLASGLQERVEAFIDENYVGGALRAEYPQFSVQAPDAFRSRRRPSSGRFHGISSERSDTAPYGDTEESPPVPAPGNAPPTPLPSYAEAPAEDVCFSGSFADSARAPDEALRAPAAHHAPAAPAAAPAPKHSLEELMGHPGESFQARLLRMIDSSGMTDPEVYKRANVDRKLFSKIRCSEDYIPKKRTIVALAIAMRLNLDDTRDLLAAAGLLLANNNRFDLIITFCIENGIYDVYEVNALLFKFEQPILG